MRLSPLGATHSKSVPNPRPTAPNPRPSCTYRLPDSERGGPQAGGPHASQHHHFVTALQWRRNSPHLLVANSAGYVWLLGLRL